MPEENAPLNLEEKRYASLTQTLSSPDKDDFDAPFEEVESIVGSADLKPYQTKLIDAVLNKISEGPEYGEGIQIKFARDVCKNLESLRGGSAKQAELIVDVLDRIISFPNANRDARKPALRVLLDSPRLRVTMKTVDSLRAAFESQKREKEETFENYAVKQVTESATQYVDSDLEEDTPLRAMFDLVIAQLLVGNLPEGHARKLTKELSANTYKNHAIVEQIMNCEALPADIRGIAKREFLKN